VIGWCAARGWEGASGATVLFLLLFVWQLPHFFAIAWMYRADYSNAGLRMLPHADPKGSRTAFAMVATAALLLPVGFLAMAVGLAGWLFAAGATLLGLMFVRQAIGFARERTDRQARRVLRASLLYLPGAFALLLVDALLVR
jgi:protoheme IX farnesyltransferase